MAKKNQQPVEAADKPARLPRTEEEKARYKMIREQFQRDKPSLQQLVSSGEYNEPLPMGEYLSIRQAVFALKKAREAAGLSLADVAEKTGIDKGALSRIETGQNINPTVSTLRRYAHALGKRWVWGLEDDQGGGVPRMCPAGAPDFGPDCGLLDTPQDGGAMPKEFDCPKCAAHLTERQLRMTSIVKEACPQCGEILRQGDAFRYENSEAILAEDVSGIDSWLAAEKESLGFDCEHLRDRESLGEYRWRATGGPLAALPSNWHLEVFYQTRNPGMVAVRMVVTEPASLSDETVMPLTAVYYSHGLQPHDERTSGFESSGPIMATRWGCMQMLSTEPLAPGLLRPVMDRLLVAMREALALREGKPS